MPKNYQILPLKVIISEVFVKSINTSHYESLTQKFREIFTLQKFFPAKVSPLKIYKRFQKERRVASELSDLIVLYNK